MVVQPTAKCGYNTTSRITATHTSVRKTVSNLSRTLASPLPAPFRQVFELKQYGES
jgi:hypothetical protein